MRFWLQRGIVVILAVLTMAALTGEGALAQSAPARGGEVQGRRGGRAAGETMTVQQVEEYFDQVMLHQARSNLSLGPDQFLRFGAALRRLQTVRRQQQRRRMALVRELNGMLSKAPLDEPALTGKLKELGDADIRSIEETRAAYEAIDGVLDLGQRARFRVFEEMMERRKLDLIARARQQARRSGTPEP
jgi:hypothetical protein